MLPDNLLAWSKQIINRYQLSAGQRLGQHFLIDKKLLRQIVKLSQLQFQEKVLEVGGGLGTLTMALLELGAQVTTVELDKKLAAGLKKLSLGNNLQVVTDDILKLDNQRIIEILKLQPEEQFSIISNLPYEISGAFLRKFLNSPLPIRQLILLLQKEVAERLQAKPGDMSLLGLLCQLTSKIELVQQVKPESFYPQPQVNSALVKIVPYSVKQKSILLAGVDWLWLWQIARAGFAAKRKQLHNNLSSALPLTSKEIQEILTGLNLSPQIRAQNLSREQWILLAKTLLKYQV